MRSQKVERNFPRKNLLSQQGQNFFFDMIYSVKRAKNFCEDKKYLVNDYNFFARIKKTQ